MTDIANTTSFLRQLKIISQSYILLSILKCKFYVPRPTTIGFSGRDIS